MGSLHFHRLQVYYKTKVDGMPKQIPTGIYVEKIEYRRNRAGKLKPIFPQAALEYKKLHDPIAALDPLGFRSPKPKEHAPFLSTVRQEYILFRGPERITNPATAKHFERAVKSFTNVCGDLPVDEYTDWKQIAEWRNTLVRDYAPASAASCIRRIHTLFSFAVTRAYLKINPITQFKMKEPEGIPTPMTQEELRAFALYALKHRPHLYNQCVYLLRTGCRSTESCVLTWDMLHFDKREIHFRNLKGRRNETFPMIQPVQDFLEHCIPRYIFPNNKVFKYANKDSLGRAFKRAITHLKLRPELSIHSLKDTYCTGLYESDIDIPTMSRLAHHKSIRTTEKHYIKYRTDKTRAGLEKAAATGMLMLPSPEEITAHEKEILIGTTDTAEICPECGKGFKHAMALSVHRRIVHHIKGKDALAAEAEVTVVCPDCGRGFRSNHAVVIHQRIAHQIKHGDGKIAEGTALHPSIKLESVSIISPSR